MKMPRGKRDALGKVLVDDFVEDEGVEAGGRGAVLGGAQHQRVLRLKHPAQVGPALRAHAHPPRQPGEPGRLARPLAQPSAPCDTHTLSVFRIRIR